MTVEELETLFRARFKDKTTKRPAISSDEYLMYLNEAQDEACVRGALIFERWAPYCSIPLAVNTQQYSLNKAIIAVVTAFVGETELHVVSADVMNATNPSWRTLPSGPAQYLVVHPGTVEIVPAPETTGTLNIEVYRFAKKLTSTAAEPEIARAFHPSLNEWVLYRGYSLPDEDTSNPTKADAALARYAAVFGGPVLARDFQDRFIDQPHINAVFP